MDENYICRFEGLSSLCRLTLRIRADSLTTCGQHDFNGLTIQLQFMDHPDDLYSGSWKATYLAEMTARSGYSLALYEFLDLLRTAASNSETKHRSSKTNENGVKFSLLTPSDLGFDTLNHDSNPFFDVLSTKLYLILMWKCSESKVPLHFPLSLEKLKIDHEKIVGRERSQASNRSQDLWKPFSFGSDQFEKKQIDHNAREAGKFRRSTSLSSKNSERINYSNPYARENRNSKTNLGQSRQSNLHLQEKSRNSPHRLANMSTRLKSNVYQNSVYEGLDEVDSHSYCASRGTNHRQSYGKFDSNRKTRSSLKKERALSSSPRKSSTESCDIMRRRRSCSSTASQAFPRTSTPLWNKDVDLASFDLISSAKKITKKKLSHSLNLDLASNHKGKYNRYTRSQGSPSISRLFESKSDRRSLEKAFSPCKSQEHNARKLFEKKKKDYANSSDHTSLEENDIWTKIQKLKTNLTNNRPSVEQLFELTESNYKLSESTASRVQSPGHYNSPQNLDEDSDSFLSLASSSNSTYDMISHRLDTLKSVLHMVDEKLNN